MSSRRAEGGESVKYHGELSPARVKEIFVGRCFSCADGKLYPHLKHFLRDLKVECVRYIPTCGLAKIEEETKLLVNEKFLRKECENDDDIADVLMHEIGHQLFGHLDYWEEEVEKHSSYSEDMKSLRPMHLTLDSIVNAHLDRIGSSGFMQKYYPDEVPWSFLRAGSAAFLLPQEEHIAAGWADRLRKIVQTSVREKRRTPPPKLLKEFQEFYSRLYRCEVTIDEAASFFKKHFPDHVPPEKEKRKFLGGNHGGMTGGDSETGDCAGNEAGRSQDRDDAGGQPAQSRDAPDDEENEGGQEKGSEMPREGEGEIHEPHPPGRGGHGRSVGSIFDLDDIRRILEELGLREPDRRTRNNFAQIIKQITTLSTEPGAFRYGTTYSTRLPARLSRRDILSIERERYVFERGEYRSREVIIFFDYSGSMAEYRKFCIALVRSLRRSEHRVRVVMWADGIKEIPYEQFLRGEIPNVGFGTQGEKVAQFLNEENVKQAVIVTDNLAGPIATKVSARVFLVLVKHGTAVGSFADRRVIPDRQIFWLETGDETRH